MKISLITACRNSATVIRSAMESVLAQKGVDLEYLVIDGGSGDGTVDAITWGRWLFLNVSTPPMPNTKC